MKEPVIWWVGHKKFMDLSSYSRTKVYLLIKEGFLKSKKFGGSLFIDYHDFCEKLNEL